MAGRAWWGQGQQDWVRGVALPKQAQHRARQTDQYYPVLFENTSAGEPNKSPEDGYHFMTDITDRGYSKSVAPAKLLMLYFAPGAAHAPHQVAKEWREKFTGKIEKVDFVLGPMNLNPTEEQELRDICTRCS